jgi:hypothetical protein
MSLAALVLSASIGAPAAPTEGAVEFRWDAPAEQCPSEADVLAQLERLLGGPVAEQGERRLAAIARVRREADGRWDLRLWTVTAEATSQRSMSGEDCAVLAEAAALLAAMAIDPSVLARGEASQAAVEQAEQAETVAGGEPAPEPIEQPEPTPPEIEPEPPKPEPAPEEPREPRRFVIAANTSGGISFGDLPGVGPIVRLGFGLQWPHARFELEGHYAFVRRARFADDSDQGADLQQGFAIARGCGVLHVKKAKLEFPICGGLEAGALAGQGIGFTVVEDGRLPWIAVDLATGLAWAPIRRLAVSVRVEPFVALLRGRFTVDEAGELWRPLPLGIRAVAGLEVRF